jgi:hypothetical protein
MMCEAMLGRGKKRGELALTSSDQALPPMRQFLRGSPPKKWSETVLVSIFA